jgi:uncharacterized protein YjbI with pentapeptide repeats
LQHLLKKVVIKSLELLLIPLVLLLIGLSIQKGISDRQEDLVVTQMVDNYFSGVANQLTAPMEISSSVIIARTRALFYRLRQLDRKNEIVNVLRFISEVSPEILKGDVFEQDPQSDRYFVDFSNIQLSGTSLEIIEVSDLRIWFSNFNYSYFDNFSCEGCGFTGSSFKNAEFNDVNFEGSDFSGANFTGSNIEDAYIKGANFEGATWSDGRKCGQKSIGKCN